MPNGLFSHLFRLTTKETLKFYITCLLWGKSICDWWISLTKGHYLGKRVMMSSCNEILWSISALWESICVANFIMVKRLLKWSQSCCFQSFKYYSCSLSIGDPILVITVPADVLIHNNARPSAGTVLTEIRSVSSAVWFLWLFCDSLAPLWTWWFNSEWPNDRWDPCLAELQGLISWLRSRSLAMKFAGGC